MMRKRKRHIQRIINVKFEVRQRKRKKITRKIKNNLNAKEEDFKCFRGKNDKKNKKKGLEEVDSSLSAPPGLGCARV